MVVPSQATRQAILELSPDLQPDRIHLAVPGIGEEARLCDPGDRGPKRVCRQPIRALGS